MNDPVAAGAPIGPSSTWELTCTELISCEKPDEIAPNVDAAGDDVALAIIASSSASAVAPENGMFPLPLLEVVALGYPLEPPGPTYCGMLALLVTIAFAIFETFGLPVVPVACATLSVIDTSGLGTSGAFEKSGAP